MKNTFSILVLIFSPLFALPQSQIVNEEIELIETFHSVNLNSRYNVYLKQSNETKIEVKALKEFLDISEFTVEDGVLNIDIERDEKDKSIWEQIDDIKIAPKLDVYLSMQEVKAISVNGNGKLVSKNSISSNTLTLNISGSGTLELDIKGKDLSINNSGNGLIKLKGYANHVNLEQSGYGKIEAFDLDLKTAIAKSTGSGDVEISVSQDLKAYVYGDSTIKFKGNTKEVKKKEYGSGKVERTY
ncbi:head GIN domain-containing protein [Ekhidna sp.]